MRQPTDGVGPAAPKRGGAVSQQLTSLQQVTQPLLLAVLIAGASHLTIRQFAGEIGSILPSLVRFLDNGFCQFIVAVFIAATAYAAMQALGQKVDRWHFEAAMGERLDETVSHRLACFLSGRHAAARNALFRATIAWQNSQPDRHSLTTLNDTVLAMREQQNGQIVQVIHFFVWVLPLLGFIGTVVGISRAIGGLEEVVQQAGLTPGSGLNDVLSGLQFAFDTTFVGLLLVIPTMLYALSLRASAQQLDMLYHASLLRRLGAAIDPIDRTERGAS